MGSFPAEQQAHSRLPLFVLQKTSRLTPCVSVSSPKLYLINFLFSTPFSFLRTNLLHSHLPNCPISFRQFVTIDNTFRDWRLFITGEHWYPPTTECVLSGFAFLRFGQEKLISRRESSCKRDENKRERNCWKFTVNWAIKKEKKLSKAVKRELLGATTKKTFSSSALMRRELFYWQHPDKSNFPMAIAMTASTPKRQEELRTNDLTLRLMLLWLLRVFVFLLLSRVGVVKQAKQTNNRPISRAFFEEWKHARLVLVSVRSLKSLQETKKSLWRRSTFRLKRNFFIFCAGKKVFHRCRLCAFFCRAILLNLLLCVRKAWNFQEGKKLAQRRLLTEKLSG